ncbi:MAG: hypothetical protein M1828_006822 [Chrysothrix sp. TS-e1954]|nr:MAG: hypothetical protein M1828_006822 [Chrysothrix sp. TS-e1954]
MSTPPVSTPPTSSINASTYAPSDDVVHNGQAWASVATVEPWDPAILTLDGGGIRGYSSLLILKALMHEVAFWERRLADGTAEAKGGEDELLPCHYFDFMYGTSTGGLIATMLGRLRMSVDQCMAIYKDVGERLFGRRRSYVPLTTKYHHRPLEGAVKDIIKAHCKQHMAVGQCGGNDWHPWNMEIDSKTGADFNRHICQSICLTAVHNGRIDEAHLLRTYDHRYVDIPNWITPYNEGADPLHIWQVTRATSAAPFYFDTLEAEVLGENWSFKDGGIRENNPAGAAWSEFVSLYGEHKDPALLLSIGTGRPDETQDGFSSAWPGPFANSSLMRKAAEKFAVVKNVLIKYTDGEEKHKDMIHTARGEHTWYKRLNVSYGLENMPLDDWKTGPWKDPKTGITSTVKGGASLSRMEQVTSHYLTRDINKLYDTYAPPKIVLRHSAEKLVRQRRARAALQKGARADTKRWDTYVGKYLTGQKTDREDGPVMHEVKDIKRPSLVNRSPVLKPVGAAVGAVKG